MARRDWNPATTQVVILGLGLDEWADPVDPSWRRHATLADLFRTAGVPSSQVLFLEDVAGTPEATRERLADVLANMDEEGLFVFYYAGHGALDDEWEDEFYFCHPTVEDDALYVSELFDLLEENFNGSHAVILADCCYSGSLARALEDLDTEGAYAVLTSSTEDIESTGNWTFTDCILAGLRGQSGIDEDEDGSISFSELVEHVMRRMRDDESQPADYAHTEAFDPAFRLAVVRG